MVTSTTMMKSMKCSDASKGSRRTTMWNCYRGWLSKSLFEKFPDANNQCSNVMATISTLGRKMHFGIKAWTEANDFGGNSWLKCIEITDI